MNNAGAPILMLVDDDVMVRLVGRQILEQHNFNIIDAENGEQAIELYKEFMPNIILMDVLMPGLNGYEACLEIRKCVHGKLVPIVMMTGLDDQGSIEHSYLVGATDFVTKPVNWTILVNRLRYILRANQITQQLNITLFDLELAMSTLAKNQTLLSRAEELAKMGSWELNLQTKEMKFSNSLYNILGIESKLQEASIDLKLMKIRKTSKGLAAQAMEMAIATKSKHEVEYWVDAEGERAEGPLSRYVKETIEYVAQPYACLLGTIQDISQLKRHEAELAKLNASLERRVEQRTVELNEKNQTLLKTLDRLKYTQEKLVSTQKMVALSNVLVGISHEIRNPLNFIVNFSDVSRVSLRAIQDFFNYYVVCDEESLRLEAKQTIEQVTANMDLILAHSKKIDEIVSIMLQHSGRIPLSLEKTNIFRIIEQAIETVETIEPFSRNVLIRIDCDKHLQPVNMMPTEIGRVMTGLLKDAVFFTKMKFEEKGEAYKPEIIVTVTNSPNYLIVCIRDNGIGISKKNINKIFDPFFTTKKTGLGAGLGLSLAWEIISIHHSGKLTVESVEGEYCAFTFKIYKKLKKLKNHDQSQEDKLKE